MPIQKLTVGEIMTTNVVTVGEDELAAQVLASLAQGENRFVVVVDGQRRPQGIITERDFLLLAIRAAPPPGWLLFEIISNTDAFVEHMQRLRRASARSAAEIMSHPVICVEETTPVIHAAAIIAERDFNQLPVVRQGVLVGAVRRSDIVKAIAIAYPPSQ